MKRLASWLTEPTLVWRSTWSVLAAFVVVWAVLLGYNYAMNHQALATGPNLRKFGHALAQALAEIDDAAQARAALRVSEHWINTRRADDERFSGRFKFALADRDGSSVYVSPGFDANAAQAADPVAHADIAGVPHRLFRAGAGRWTLSIAEPRRMPADFLAYNARNLLPYLLLASPIVLLAVWLSVRNGLRPLQRLATRIAGRRDDDLQPVGLDVRHRELRPLVQALDRLLGHARERLQHERAFVQDAAHELRTPLAVITAQAHVLAHSPEGAARAAAQQHLEQAIQRSAHLAQQLLDLAELDEAARGTPQAADLAEPLRALLAQAAPAAMARGIELVLEAPEHLVRPTALPALQSVVTNLVDNALRYGAPGGTVLVTLRALGAGWALAVQDDGPGIAPAEHARVFERFYRAAGQAASGSGLGLAIVRQAVSRLGGTVHIGAGLHGRGVGLFVEVPAAREASS